MKYSKVLFISVFLLFQGALYAQTASMERAVNYFGAEQYSRSIPLLESILELYPDYEEAQILLAASYLRNGSPDIADFKAEGALKHHPDSATLFWLRGEAHVGKQLLMEAIPFYAKALETINRGGKIRIFPVSESEIKESLARLYQYGSVRHYQNGNLDDATQYARKATDYDPQTLPYHKNLLYLLYESGQNEETLHQADRALEKFPGNPVLIRIKASVYNRLEDFEKLKSEFRQLYEQDPEDPDIAMLFAEILIANQKSGEAEKIYQDLLYLYPDERRIYFALAALYERRFTLEQKMDVLKQLLERFPDDKEVLSDKASLYEVLKEFEDARRIYNRLKHITGEQLEYGLRIARTYREELKIDDALSMYQEMLAGHPLSEELMLEYGWYLADLEKWDKLKETVTNYYGLSDNPAVLELKGYSTFMGGDVISAETILRKAIEQKAFTARTLLLLSRITFQDSQGEALEFATEAFRLVFRDMAFEQQLVETRLRSEGLQAGMGGMNLDEVERLNKLSKEIFKFFTQTFDKEKIIPVLNWMVNTYSNSSVLLTMTGSWYESVGDYDRSLELYTSSVRYRASNIEGHLGMARIYEHNNEPDSAILSYERALALDRENPMIYRSLIRLYRSKGELNKLTDRWLILLRNHPDNNILREHLIEALHRSDRFEEARALTSGS